MGHGINQELVVIIIMEAMAHESNGSEKAEVEVVAFLLHVSMSQSVN